MDSQSARAGLDLVFIAGLLGGFEDSTGPIKRQRLRGLASGRARGRRDDVEGLTNSPLSFVLQALEGSFRSSHSRLIAHSEEVAFLQGADTERGILDK